MVRLSQAEILAIKDAIGRFDPDAAIFLFGSRANPKKKGGDIDLLILSDRIHPSDKTTIKLELFKQIEEQKIDLIIAKDDTDPFVKIALSEGVRL